MSRKSKARSRRQLVRANQQRSLQAFRFCTGAGSVELTAAEPAQGDTPAKLPRFKMNVYNGGAMRVDYYGSVVIDLAGLSIPDRAVPVHRDHDVGKIVGHGEARIEGGRVWIEGEISGTGEAALEVVGNGKNGFPWQASIEAAPLRVEEIKAGAQAQVNGKPVSGPIAVIRRSELKGASFVSLGADSSTRAQVAASKKRTEDADMEFKEWVRAKGFDPEALTEDQEKTLRAAYDAEQAADKADKAKKDEPKPQAATPAVQATGASAADEIKAERQRVADIEAACKGDWSDEDKVKVEDIRAKAVRDGESVAQVNSELLTILRASRPQSSAPAFIQGGPAPTQQLLVAALCIANQSAIGMRDEELTASFGEQTMEGAHKLGRARLTEIIAAAAALDGVSLPRFGRGSQEWVRAAFSSVSLSGILGAVANKSLLAAYRSITPGIRRIFKRGTVSNFQTHTRYRLTAAGGFEKMAPAGELQHGSLGEQTYTQKADTYGRYFQLTRQDVVNDDLGAFLELPAVMGRGWALAIEEAGVTLLLSNPSSFFAESPTGYAANYATGEATALSTTGLDAAMTLLLSQVDNHAKPIAVDARFLVVPPALKALADRLYKSSNLGTVASGLSSTSSRAVEQAPEANIYAGRYEPVCIPQLASASFTGYSATAWYLWADPAALAAFEVAYLNGQDMPTIEQVGVASDTLGLGFRGYGDFGVAAVDPRAAVKMAGA